MIGVVDSDLGDRDRLYRELLLLNKGLCDNVISTWEGRYDHLHLVCFMTHQSDFPLEFGDIMTQWSMAVTHPVIRVLRHASVKIHKLSVDENIFKTLFLLINGFSVCCNIVQMSNVLCLFSLGGSVCPGDCLSGWEGQAGPPNSLPVCPTREARWLWYTQVLPTTAQAVQLN